MKNFKLNIDTSKDALEDALGIDPAEISAKIHKPLTGEKNLTEVELLSILAEIADTNEELVYLCFIAGAFCKSMEEAT